MPKQDEWWRDWEGVTSPNTTPFPDDLLDYVLGRVSPAEWKVLCYIVRHTYGWKKDGDHISLKQMVDGIVTHDGRLLDSGTGMSKPTVIKALQGLTRMGLVLVHKERSADLEYETNFYSIRQRAEPLEGGSKESLLPQSKNLTNKKQPYKKQKTTESGPPAASTVAKPQAARAKSDSDSLQAWAEATATALGRPAETKQLATWARKQAIPTDILQAAAEVTGQQADLKKPVAYLQTVAKVMLAEREAATEVGKRKAADRREAALAYGREVYADRIIGGSWASVESIVGESYGPDLAAEVVEVLKGE
jgi:hypothetical protein